MPISKVVFGDQTLIDLTSDTVSADKLLQGVTAHAKDGNKVTGTCTFDADTGDATAQASEILSGKTAYVNSSKVAGSMPNKGGVSGEISDVNTPYTIPSGYHDGSGTVKISDDEKLKITPNNIRDGITILGVAGAMSGTEGLNPQQTIVPDEGYNALSQVVVKAIPYQETENNAGGLTATIAGAA